MPQTAPRWTAEMVRALPDDGNRCEVIDGELLVTPAPSAGHQRLVQPDVFVAPVRPGSRKVRQWSDIKGLVLDARVIERWRRGDQRPEVLSDRLIWQPAPSVPPLEIDLPAFFRDALDD